MLILIFMQIKLFLSSLFLSLTLLFSFSTEASSKKKASVNDAGETLQDAKKGMAEEDEDVNTLNGQLVRVGENNEYKTSYKKYNIGISPLGIIVGNYFIDGSIAVHSNVAVKAELGYIYEPYGIDVKGFSSSIYVPFYFRKMYTGFYLEPGLSFHSLKDLDGSDSASAFGPLMHIGYHWIWDSGLNISMAVGVQRNFIDNDDSIFDDFTKFRGSGYLRAGWAF